MSAAAGYGVHAIAVRVSPACVCVQEDISPSAVGADGTVTGAFATRVIVSTCRCAPREASLSRRSLGEGIRFLPAGVLHWGAAAALSFARGVNDNAKIAAIGALGLTALHADLWIAFVVAALAMTIGSYAAGLRVTRTLGDRVVRMDQDTGLAASFVSAALVLAASFYALPVSTTHVATGAIVGAGLRQDPAAVRWRRVGGLMTAWIVTLPIAAALAALAVWTLGMDA
jgi:PiT family inorganic phosphate transporter